jgi:hypothetical protein
MGHSPSSLEYKHHGQYDITTVRRKFKKTWKQIIESTGLRYTPRTFRKIPSTEELRRDVLRVANEIGHAPIKAEYQARGRFDPETVRRRSGERRWEEAVAKIAGVSPEDIKRYQQRGGRYRTTEEWLERLRKLSLKLGHAPTTNESNKAGINAHQLCLRVGGKWVDVLRAAGIDIRSRSKYANLRSTPTETMIEDVLSLSRRLGRLPTILEYEKYGHYSCTAVRIRVGGWRKMKKFIAARLTGI